MKKIICAFPSLRRTFYPNWVLVKSFNKEFVENYSYGNTVVKSNKFLAHYNIYFSDVKNEYKLKIENTNDFPLDKFRNSTVYSEALICLSELNNKLKK